VDGILHAVAAQTVVREVEIGVREPFAAGELLAFLAYHVVPGVEAADAGTYARTLHLPHGPGAVRVALADGEPVRARVELTDPVDLDDAVDAVRRMLGADDDTDPVHAHLDDDPLLGPLARARPGLRVPGQVDGAETAVRTVIGQQVSVVGARTVTARIVAAHGRRVDVGEALGVPGLTHLFPTSAALAGADPETLPMPRARGRAIVALTTALADGAVRLDPDGGAAGRAQSRAAMLALPGIGPWTADYVAMRVLREPDAFLPTDLGVRQALARLGHDPALVLDRAGGVVERWRPWRSYALMHLWATLMPTVVA
jgi:AraC family transcriptional regulator of adaptative response / DNA-3-methyladenine glycosylase II